MYIKFKEKQIINPQEEKRTEEIIGTERKFPQQE